MPAMPSPHDLPYSTANESRTARDGGVAIEPVAGSDLHNWSRAGQREMLFLIVRRLIHWQNECLGCLENPTRRFAERFRVVERLGRGGFGSVLRVIDERRSFANVDQQCALKLLTVEIDEASQGLLDLTEIAPAWFETRWRAVTAWLQEIVRHRALSKQNIAGLVPLLDASVPDACTLDAIVRHLQEKPCWLTMPVFPRTLAHYVRERGVAGVLPVPEALRIMRSVAETFVQLHAFRTDIIHGDLKPANLLLDEADNVFVADFGLAAYRPGQPLWSASISGTWPYMAPELWNGYAAQERSDVWAWGVISYELLSGQRPFFGTSREEIRERVTNAQPAAPLDKQGSVPLWLSSCVMECLAKEPTQPRIGSFRQLVARLKTQASVDIELAWSADGSRKTLAAGLSANGALAVVSSGPRATVFDPSTPRSVHPLQTTTAFGADAALVTDNGRRLLVGNQKGQLAVWNLEEFPTRIAEEAGPVSLQQWIYCVAASSDAQHVVAASGNTLWHWNAPAPWRKLARLNTREILALTMVRDGRWVFAGGRDGSLWHVDLATAAATQLPIRHFDAVTCLACSPQGDVLVSGGKDKQVLFGTGSPWNWHRPAIKHKSSVTCVALSADLSHAFSGDHDGLACAWHLTRGDVAKTWQLASPVRGLLSAKHAPDRLILVGDAEAITRRFPESVMAT